MTVQAGNGAARARCADLAEILGDPLVGNAPPATRWLLVEHPGPWGRRTLVESRIDPVAVGALAAWERAVRGRVVLIRRPGRRVPGGPRRWLRVDARPGSEEMRGGTFGEERELAAVVDAPGEPVDGPLHLVCAHGRHDTCCAVRGRPVAAALADLDPERTWECSHVGGCRFASALVLLPHGFVFGRVTPAEAVQLARGYRAGTIDPERLRGRSSLTPVEQAAQHFAREATGERGVDALRPVAVEALDLRWRVVLDRPHATVELVERQTPVDRPLTCAGSVPGRLREFDLVRVEVAAAHPR